MFFEILYYASYVILIPGLLFALYAQFAVKTSYKRYENQLSEGNYTASDVARILLEKNNCPVLVEKIPGNLTDNYNPKSKVLSLSQGVYGSTSIAAIGIAAHEVGHAIQHNQNYLPLKIRSVAVPVVNIGSWLAIPLAIIGVLIEWLTDAGNETALVFINLGIVFYSFTTLFALLTLPVELDASRRASQMLAEYGFLSESENRNARKVLRAAALTYVASLVVSLLYLVRFIVIISSLRRKD